MRRAPMADKSAKRERKIPKRFIEFAEAWPKNFKKIKAANISIYPVERTQGDKARDKVKIHG